MNAQKLIEIARTLVSDDKGLLAMDESNATCDKRFAAAGIAQTLEARRAYRELIVTTPGLGACISGAILYDETIRQQKRDGTPFVKVLADAGIIPGIKVDIGAKDLAGHPGEKVTEGLDGLRDRLKQYFQMGARFAKWRAVIAFGEVFGWAHSLNQKIREAPWFYASYFFMLITAGLVVLIPGAPLVLITLFVQVIAVTLLPAALVFLILLLNDKPLMGEHVNTRSQNIANWSITAFVIAMSTAYGVSVLFPEWFGSGH